MPVELLLVFFVTASLLAITPGPDNIFVLTQSLAYGSRAGLLVVLGLCTGLVMHTSLVALGLAALIASSDQLLLVIKLLGAAYLLYLAWQNWQHSRQLQTGSSPVQLRNWQLYRRGIIMNATNPKVGLFFLAFLPQFLDVGYGPLTTQMILLGGLFILSTLLVFGAIAVLAGRLGQQMQMASGRRLWFSRSVSVIFVLLALNLFIDLV
ncbi:MAG: LysE family translocator [Gammaproteobacteria bacterium]|nr:LysE family translocator [Gammaproteobacteria bacterium]